jgi:hypothetical protein
MVEIKSVKIDGTDIHIFKSVIYIFESSSGYSMELGMVVSEVVLRKYGHEENLILEIELEDGRVINTIMQPQGFLGGVPRLHLYCDIDDVEDYPAFQVVKESDESFPKLDEGITIEEIRKYEMPNEKVNLKLTLPIDQAEWIAKQKKSDINTIIKEAIYDYWKNQK